MTAGALDDPLTAAEAAERFASGAITKRRLADAMREGVLEHTRIGRTRLTTERWIREWMNRCREKPRGRASTSESDGVAMRSGSSVTVEAKLAQDVASATARALTKRSGNTSSGVAARLAHREQRAN